MRYDTIIIGGGMSGLVSGIRLAKAGLKVAIVSSGQSALHFSSGSMALFGHDAQGDVVNPLEGMAHLPITHPYMKIGMDTVKRLLPDVKPLFAEAGITLSGTENKNHLRLTPVGAFKPAWLSMLDYAVTDSLDNMTWGKVAVVNLKGYLDFYPDFIARGLNACGLECVTREFTLSELEVLRKSSTEMRATNIARVLTGKVLEDFAREINRIIEETKAETVLMPAVVGLFDEEPVNKLREMVSRKVLYVSTMPMSLGGMRAQMRLRSHFQKLGGTYLIGDSVSYGVIEGDRLKRVYTVNLGDMPIEAENFVLATGSFFSHGLEATPDTIYEPIFGLDVNASHSRSDWYEMDMYKEQNYMKFGVVTDEDFHVFKSQRPIHNFRAVGAVVGAHDALKEESGAGVSILTSLKVADDIINGK